MAEIRINATGGVKLYDADDSHYAQILAGTISSNVDALTLGSSSADFNIPVKVLGTTPTLTIGDAGAEDTKIVFDGNAQDFYIGLDDSADDLLIGLGSTVGTTPAISINSDRDVTISDGAIDFDIASHDGSNGLKLAGTLVTATAAELNLLDGGTSVGSSITLADADGIIVNDGGTMKTIPASDISTYAGGGITTAGWWHLSSSFNDSADPITANLVETIAMGSSLTVSSGVFTFPSTGFWWIHWHIGWARGDTDAVYCNGVIRFTDDDGSSWANRAMGTNFQAHAGVSNQATLDTIVDITNVSNDKVSFSTDVEHSSVTTRGSAGYPKHTYMTFIRLGDT